jgi:hypothetical protein
VFLSSLATTAALVVWDVAQRLVDVGPAAGPGRFPALPTVHLHAHRIGAS